MTETEKIASHAAVVKRDGFTVVSEALDTDVLGQLAGDIDSVGSDAPGVRARNGMYAIRNLVELSPSVKRVLRCSSVTDLVESILGPESFLVGGQYFNKLAGASWKVPWHQDTTIAVREKADATGFGPWTRKAGIQHVQAPPHVLAGLLILRLHLDECGEDNGPLRVIKGSHYFGRLPTDSIEQFTRGDCEAVSVPRGGVLAMKPLLLHSSSVASKVDGRRVVQLLFAGRPLPAPLSWYEAHRW